MTITDKRALSILGKIDSSILRETVESYPEYEREGRTDLEFLADEISYQIYCFKDEDHEWSANLADARRILRRAKSGMDNEDNGIMDVGSAESLVSEYKRLVSALRGLQRSGIYGFWYHL